MLLLCAALGPAVPAHATTPGEYRQAVAEALTILDEAAADEAAWAAALTRATERLARLGPVEVGGGKQVTPVNPPLSAATAESDLPAARATLTALLDALDAAIAAGAPPADAGRLLGTILAQPEFRPPEPGLFERLLGPALEPLRLAWERFWRGLVARLSAPGEGGTNLLLLMLGGLVVAGLAALMAGAFSGSVVSGARTADSRRGARTAPHASRARAFELAARGDYRAAVHELHLATLLALDERGLLRFRPHLTNREHLVGNHIQPQVLRALVPAIDVYDQLWYSGGAIGAEDWRRFATLADAVHSIGVRSGVAAGSAEPGAGSHEP